MAVTRVLILFMILTLFFVNAHAQCDARSQQFVQEPFGVFQNEMEGFKFFGGGKLNSLRLGVSTREDVAKIFGKPDRIEKNEEYFEYDSDWSMVIYYLGKAAPLHMSAINDQVTGTFLPAITFSTAPEYIDKIYSIRLQTKKRKPFNQQFDSDTFTKRTGRQIYDYLEYRDVYGLSYTVFEKFPDERAAVLYPYAKGDMVEINYRIECPVQRKVFIADK